MRKNKNLHTATGFINVKITWESNFASSNKVENTIDKIQQFQLCVFTIEKFSNIFQGVMCLTVATSSKKAKFTNILNGLQQENGKMYVVIYL